MIKIRNRVPLTCPINVMPSDTILLTYTDEHGKEHKLVKDNIGFQATFDEAAIFDLTDELGYDVAIGAILGQRAVHPRGTP